MGNEAENTRRLEKVYARWHETRGGSADDILNLAADDIQFGSLAEGAAPVPFTAARTNRDALRDYFAGLLGEWEMIHYTVQEFVAQGECVVMRGSTAWRNKRTGKTLETPKVDFWRFRDGKAVEFYEYYDTARLIEAAS